MTETVVQVEQGRPQNTGPPPPKPDGQQQTQDPLSWIAHNTAYFQTVPGVLKLIQLVRWLCNSEEVLPLSGTLFLLFSAFVQCLWLWFDVRFKCVYVCDWLFSDLVCECDQPNFRIDNFKTNSFSCNQKRIIYKRPVFPSITKKRYKIQQNSFFIHDFMSLMVNSDIYSTKFYKLFKSPQKFILDQKTITENKMACFCFVMWE